MYLYELTDDKKEFEISLSYFLPCQNEKKQLHVEALKHFQVDN